MTRPPRPHAKREVRGPGLALLESCVDLAQGGEARRLVYDALGRTEDMRVVPLLESRLLT